MKNLKFNKLLNLTWDIINKNFSWKISNKTNIKYPIDYIKEININYKNMDDVDILNYDSFVKVNIIFIFALFLSFLFFIN